MEIGKVCIDMRDTHTEGCKDLKEEDSSIHFGFVVVSCPSCFSNKRKEVFVCVCYTRGPFLMAGC